jgi:opacity protein-like surface antigen
LAARAAAAGPGADGDPGLTLQFVPALAAMAPPTPEAQANPDQQATPRPFGEQDTWRWYVQGGLGLDVQDAGNQIYLLGGGVSYFIVDGLSLNLELNGLAVNQVGDDALGLGLTFLARFHFLNRPRWSMYAEVGAGILGTTADVPGPTPEEPRGGTQFSFTPQIGGGCTFQLNPEVHLMAGVRWYHISNANTWADNPGRDSILFYCGVTVPF